MFDIAEFTPAAAAGATADGGGGAAVSEHDKESDKFVWAIMNKMLPRNSGQVLPFEQRPPACDRWKRTFGLPPMPPTAEILAFTKKPPPPKPSGLFRLNFEPPPVPA